ncbi:AsmA-like C-terminal region-containing protein [Nioella ostreopsis]|uniref:AsmA-like C-terminal region-containing protein n=1 Tax=Nioella ostreopsis TaxID=2448479 RepID=UPI000FDC5BC2|nr:AsmA-like C-terminal region-containing protein [Nioella ostreopsis]
MSDTGPDPEPRRLRRRGPLRWILRGLALLVLLLAAGILFLAFPPNGRAVPLPEWSRARIEAALDASMPGGQITVGEIGLSLSRGTLQPRIRFTEMQLSDGDRPRVVFPVLQVELDRAAALRGELRPRQVSVGGAGLRIRRDEDGSFDLAFTGAETSEARDLSQTLAGIDRMFQQTVFSRLIRVVGEDITLVIDDMRSGDTTRITGATLALVPEGEALVLSVAGQLDGSDGGAIELTFTRRAELGETEFTGAFSNLQSADIARVSDALTWLTLVEAPMSGRLSTVLFDDASVGTLSGTLAVGAGHVSPGGAVDPLPLNSLNLSFDYNAGDARMWIEEFTVDAPALSARITGHATLLDGPVYVSQLQLSQITADPPGLFEAPVSFAGGALDMRLQLFPFVAMDFGQAVLFDEGLHLTARGRVAAQEAGLAVRLDAEIPQLDAQRVVPLWPVAQIPNTREWLTENVISGSLGNIHAALRIAPETDPQFGLTFDFEGAEVRAIRDMAPIQQGRGYMDISRNVLSLALHEGHVTAPNGGRLDLAGSLMRIDDTRVAYSPASFDLQIGGPISSVLTLIGADPFNLLDQFPYDPGMVASGRADLDVSLAMEMRPRIMPQDVTFQIGGTLRNVRSDQFVPGRELRAAALNITADNDTLAIGGPARLDGLHANATWRRALGPDSTPASTVRGTATLTPEALTEFGVILPDGMLRGQGEARFDLALDRGEPPRLSVSSDLAGLALSVPSLGWSLPTGSTGRLEADLILGDAPDVPRLEIAGNGLTLAGSVQISDEQQFERLEITRLSLSDWLDISGALVSRGAGRTPQINVTGGTVDLRGLPSGGAGTGQALPLNILLDRLEITDSIFLTNLRTELSGTPVSGDFRGLMGGAVPVSGTVLSEANGTALRLRSDDGGAVLRAAGIYQNAYGGAMDLILRPRAGEGNYSGLLTIDNPRLRHAPAFAELLSAISVVGLLEQMVTGEGIGLGEVRAAFTLSPDALAIQEGTALGPSMGLSLDGTYDLRARYYDFEGVVSPLYMVNGLVGGLFSPRREGLFGFTYRLTGTPEDSSVSVNPLSVLTPGIFREIFRRPPPEPAE